MAAKFTRNIERRTGLQYRGRELVVRMTAQGLQVKLDRERWDSGYFVPYEAIYDLGAKLQAVASKPVSTRFKRGLLSL